jgi:hypothetical protein
MGRYFTEFNGRVFWIGTLAGAPLSFVSLLAIPFHWNSVVATVLVKMAAGCLSSFGGGIFLALANDVYKHQIKHRFEKIIKPKIRRHGKQDDNERAA